MPPARRGYSAGMPEVAIAHDPQDIGNAIASALSTIDVGSVVRGKRVAIKPNDTWASPEDTTAVTQPDTLRAVIRYIRRFEPRELVVSGGSGAGETDEIFRIAGLMDVVEDEGVEFFDHNRRPFTEVELDYGGDPEVEGPQRRVVVNERILSYESLVVVSLLKLHSVATVTLALKNVAMSYPAADHYGHPRKEENQQHAFFDDMHSFIAVMAKRFPIDLAITVGQPAMIGTGPIGGHAFDTGLAIASRDAVAADVVGARLLGFRAQAVRHLWEAGRLGLGETDLDKIEIRGVQLPDAAKAFAQAAYGKPLTLGTD